jgi:hypothetical protein
MANDELQAMVRDELFWDPRVDGDAVAVSGKRRRGHPMSTAKAKPPERVSRRRRAARAQTSGRARRCDLLSPPIADYGVRVGLPYRRAGRSWNLSKYDDYCVRWKDTCCCWS